MPLIYEPRGKAAEYSPLAMNIYKGCSHGCVYCYAPSATYKKRDVFHSNVQPRNNFFQELGKDIIKFRGDKRPILLCFTTDPYQPIEETAKLTRISIKRLIENGSTVKVLTKGGTRAVRDFDIMKTGNCDFGATLTFMDEKRSIEWEPGAASPADRINALRMAKEAGIKTWVSLEPVIDPEQVYEIIKATHEFVDLYKVGKINYHPLSKTIDWHDFRVNVESLLTSLSKDFYIKEDIRKF
jgi:DNA repair photolyase